VDVDTSRWSGDGAFTRTLIEAVRTLPGLDRVRVEDAPSSRAESDYNLISNELFVTFSVHDGARRWTWGVFPRRGRPEKALTFDRFEALLAELEDVGPADYVDESMLQYLRTERVVAPYQTRGYKLVELVRIYEVGTEPRR
jgi:hypothetical protein